MRWKGFCNRLPVPSCFLPSDLLITVLLLSQLPNPWLGHRLGHRLGQLSLCCLHLSHVYIEALELHSISSRSCNSSHCKAHSFRSDRKPVVCEAAFNEVVEEAELVD